MAIPTIFNYTLPKSSPENRTNWYVEPKRAVLLIHDMQQYFLDYFDAESDLVQKLIANIQTIKQACVEAGIPVVYTAQPGDQCPKERALLTDFWGPGLKAEHQVTRIVESLEPTQDDLLLTTWRYSAFQRTSLQAFMQEEKRDQLIIVGVYAHIGCLQTASEAFMNDIQAFMITNAVADFSLDEHEMALNYVAGRCGHVLDKDQFLHQVTQTTNSDLSGQQQYVAPRSISQLQQQLAALLDVSVEELTPHDHLTDFGLDSIRVMTLLSHWQKEGLDIHFMELATQPNLTGWWQVIQTKQALHSA